MNIKTLKTQLQCLKNKERAEINMRFFKTGKGKYGEGDQFLGITMPQLRKVIKQIKDSVSRDNIKTFLASKWHEERMLGALFLVRAFQKNPSAQYLNLYISQLGKGINNWDLIDATTEHIIGAYTYIKHDSKILSDLCKHKNMWKRRAGIVSTFYWLKQKDYSTTLICAEHLLHDKEDLIHKATGWMLREMGKRGGEKELRAFLKNHAHIMPRTMLRYAIERFTPKDRAFFLSNKRFLEKS